MPPSVESLAVVALASCAALAVGLLWMSIKMRALERRLAAGGGDPAASERLASVERELGACTRREEHLTARVDRLSEETRGCLRHAGIVRYDAFQEVGGHLSFSVALLDGRRDGVVLSVLNDREGARAYAKPVTGGRSTFNLSEEEQRAIAQG